MRIKTENDEESLEPVHVDKAGLDASGEGTHGLSKMFAVLGYCIPNSFNRQSLFKKHCCVSVCVCMCLEKTQRNLYNADTLRLLPRLCRQFF